MIYNVRLRRTCVYDIAIDADNPDRAVDMAKKISRRDHSNWAVEGPIRKVSVHPDPDALDLGEIDPYDEIIAEDLAAFYGELEDKDVDRESSEKANMN